MHSRPNLTAALFWLGVALLLLPFAALCVAVVVAAAPKMILIVGGVVVFTLGRKLLEGRRADG